MQHGPLRLFKVNLHTKVNLNIWGGGRAGHHSAGVKAQQEILPGHQDSEVREQCGPCSPRMFTPLLVGMFCECQPT